MTDEHEHEHDDADRLELLDRLHDRIPELDLDQHEIDWHRLPDGHDALLVDGGGLDGKGGMYFANAGDDVHAVGSLQPLGLYPANSMFVSDYLTTKGQEASLDFQMVEDLGFEIITHDHMENAVAELPAT